MNRKLIAFFFAVSLAACGHQANVTTRSAGSNTSSTGGTTLVPKGTEYYGKLQQPISTKTSHDGDTFVLVQTDTMLHKNPQLHGSAIEGHVENVRSAGPMRKPQMIVVFDDIRMADGTKAPIDVRLESMNKFAPKTHHLRTIGMMIGGAVAGHEVSKHTGAHHGATLGAASAYMVSQQLKTDVSVPAGTVIEVKFLQPATSGSNTNG